VACIRSRLYATFINRAFDQVLMDVAPYRAGATFVLDRAGVTGPTDRAITGWDPRSCRSFAHPLQRSMGRNPPARRVGRGYRCGGCPTVVRFSAGSVGTEIAAVRRLPDGVDVS
jgi:1-deoxy-D-xylulose-5-phosphate synthase